MNYNVTDDGENRKSIATVYQVSGKSEHTLVYKTWFSERKRGNLCHGWKTAIPTVGRLRRKHYGRYPSGENYKLEMERLRQKAVK